MLRGHAISTAGVTIPGKCNQAKWQNQSPLPTLPVLTGASQKHTHKTDRWDLWEVMTDMSIYQV